MTIGFQITDGTTTVDLNDGAYYEVMELELGYGDVSQQTVAGSARLYIDGTKSQIQTELAALQKLLQMAIDYSGRSSGAALYDALDKKIYLNYRTDSSENYYRSRLTKTGIVIETQGLEVLNFDCGGIEIVLTWERYNWWEGPEAQLALSNHLATDSTDAMIVYNPDIMYTATTISFAHGATEEIQDSANGLGNFKVGDTIVVTGSTSNDATYIVMSSSAGALETDIPVTGEVAGDTITISGAYCDYVDIDGTDVTGDLPAACRIQCESLYTNADNLYDVYIGQNYTNPSAFQWIYQFEDATEAAGGTEGGGFYSQNYYYSATITSGVEQIAASWPLTSAQVEAAAGRYFRAFIFGSTLDTSNPRYRIKISYGAGQDTIWEGQQFKVSTTDWMYDLGIVRIPPSLAGLTAIYDTLYLELWMYQSSGTDKSYALDFLKLMPVDGYFVASAVAYGLDTYDRLVVDGIEEYLYKTSGAGTHVAPIFSPLGTPIMLQPGRNQRLYFTQQLGTAGDWDIEMTMGVKVYYRPRRLTI